MDRQTSEFFDKLKLPFLLVVILWCSEFYELLFDKNLSRNGIYPREIDGLLGIITSPFIHDDFQHLMSNTVPLFTLTSVMMFFYPRVAIPSYGIIQILTGFTVWLFARPSYHIGASGVVYGLVSFVFWSGVFRRNLKSIVLALIVVVMYSGYFYGILPNKDGVSWESHLFGGFVGIFTAFLLKGVKEPDEEEQKYTWELEEDEGTFFLPRDTFEKTKYQRKLEAEMKRRQEQFGSEWTSDQT